MNRKLRLRALFGFAAFYLFAMTGFVRAAEPETVIVPYDAKKSLAGQQPDQLYLPYERFLQLWEAAKQQRRPEAKAPAPQPWALTSARYDGVVGEESIAFVAKLDLFTANEQWVKVPLPFDRLKVSAMSLDDATAAFDGKTLVVEKPGRHSLEVRFEVSLRRSSPHIAFEIPQAAAAVVSLTLRDAQGRATIAPGDGAIERLSDGRKVVSAAVGAADRIQIELLPPSSAVRVADPASAEVRQQVTVRAGVEDLRATVAFAFPGARQDRFTVRFDSDLALAGLDASNVKSWRLVRQNEVQVLEITLHEPAEGSYLLTLEADRPLPALPQTRKAPQVAPAAARVEYVATALFAAPRIELTPEPAAGQPQVEWKGEPSVAGRFVAAFAGAGPLGYRAAPHTLQREASVDYAYQVDRRKIELIASLELAAKGDDLFDVAVTLPEGFEIQSVTSARLQDWWREGQTLHVRFAGATPAVTPLVVYLVRQFPAAPTQLAVQPLALEGFQRVSGEAVIAAHKGVEAALTLNPDAREVAPDKAATDFQILPPLERKRGFTFKTQAFAGQVMLTALPAKLNALWVLHAEAHEGWLALSTRVRLTLRQGSVDRASFSLPAAVPEVRVSGGEVREARSHVDGDRRVYDVQFQNDIHETVEFTLDTELPNPGDAALPAIAFPDAQMTTGYVLVDNASEYEMRLETNGIDPAPRREIPFLPELSKNASIFRVQPGWSVKVGIERLEKAESRAAFVAYAELTAALRRDGTEWHRATYRLQNRSLQFLPVRLPAGAELMGVRVAGIRVRADAGSIGGKPAILIPLIKTKPGDLSYDVEVVYRRVGKEPGTWSTARLDDPDLPGITVERTLWNVWLPEDRELRGSAGNMEPVLAEVNKTEKMSSALDELKSLAAIVSSAGSSTLTKSRARDNFYRLKQSVEDANELATKPLYESVDELKFDAGEKLVSKKESLSQRTEVAGRKAQIVKEIAQQTRQVEELSKTLPQVQAEVSDGGNLNQQQQRLSLEGQQAWQSQPGAVRTFTGAEVNARWTLNSEAAPSAPAQTPVEQQLAGNRLYVNDNVILQQKDFDRGISMHVEAKGKAEDKAGRASDEREKLAEVSTSEARAQIVRTLDPTPGEDARRADTRGKPVPEPAVKPQAASTPAPEQPQVFNTARGNRAAVEQQATQLGTIAAQPSAGQPARPMAREPQAPQSATQPAFPVTPTTPAELRAATAAAALPPPSPMGDGLAKPPAVPAVQAFGARGGGAGFGPAAQAGGVAAGGTSGTAADDAQRLQPQGRISLAVDFPTEGRVLHFKKVKANADLRLSTVSPNSFARWKALGWALCYAAALAALRYAIGQWQRRRRVMA